MDPKHRDARTDLGSGTGSKPFASVKSAFVLAHRVFSSVAPFLLTVPSVVNGSPWRGAGVATVLTCVLAGMAGCSGAPADEPPQQVDTPLDPPKPPVLPEVPKPVIPEFDALDCTTTTPVPTEGRLLTRLQYQNSIDDLFQGVVRGHWTAAFPAENEVLGFRTSAEFHRATPWLAEAQMVAAEAVAAQVRANIELIAPCASAALDEAADSAKACARDFLATYGFRAFRRPLTAEEQQPLLALFAQGLEEQGSAYGLELVTQALLQSPQFLYRFEAPRSPDETNGAAERVDNFGLASRLSYLFWNSMPDDQLFAVAQAGTLEQPDVLQAQAERMLASPKAASAIKDFADQWLGLTSLNGAVRNSPQVMNGSSVNVEPSPDEPGEATTRYSNAWRSSVLTYMSELYANGANFRTLMSSPDVYLDRSLAPIYAASVPDETPEGYFVNVAFPEGERAGLLTQPGLMALLAHADQSAPILRGVFVRDKILCQPTPPAPPTVDPTPPMLDPQATTRERFAQHTADASCSGCHSLIDPIGLGFENYDELGRYRTTENGLDIDASGRLVGLRETAIQGDFVGAVGLSERLAESVQAQTCFVTQWYRYGMGRVEQTEDLCSLKQLVHAFIESDGDLRQMLTSLVTTDAFRYRTWGDSSQQTSTNEEQ